MTLNGNHACCPSDYQTCGMTMCTCEIGADPMQIVLTFLRAEFYLLCQYARNGLRSQPDMLRKWMLRCWSGLLR